MPRAVVGEVELEYERFGSTDDPAVLLIMGLGAQMIVWPRDLIDALVDRYFQVIVFDNRDIGLSTKFPDIDPDPWTVMAAVAAGTETELAYTLSDMASDAAGLLEALDIDQAHIVGASMGGMIAQLVAIEHPAKTLTLTSIMSTTGNPDVGGASEEAAGALSLPAAEGREAHLDQAIETATIWASPEYIDREAMRDRAARAWDRAGGPEGPETMRQISAIFAAPNREPELSQLAVPTLVVHGDLDPLVRTSGGERTAEIVPGAELLIIEGMAHDLPQHFLPQIVEGITRVAMRALPQDA